MAVRIVVDSSAGLPRDIVEKFDITVVDLHVMEEDSTSSTSGLSAVELAACYARQLERGGDEGVVALHLAKGLSSTWSAAVTASAVFPGTVRVVDTDTAGMAIGAAAMAAASLARDGGSLDECEEIAAGTLASAETWVYLNQLDDLRKSGRLSAGTAVLSAALLATRPILHVTSGKLELAGKTRTQTKAFIKLTQLVQAQADGEPVFAAIQHADSPTAARSLENMLNEVLPAGSQVLVLPIAEAVAVHVGAGAIGLSAVFSSQARAHGTEGTVSVEDKGGIEGTEEQGDTGPGERGEEPGPAR
ncbi:DegV family protein [Corynebacterium liangguodongii]|uniref:Fatty acid-binding protein DegV n=1 Tax=Corynebacterium liangguodongii TaxID=2079535 RepID=A0A2S0WFF1_9CORY|nr:DegV family protein [Corynebacterium liangguodongii]AWB84501.1 fatty acid-binding protein DegV [Corynebacterium liangguodongii]PWB98719.1 DegV family EDD domain-containing protein [Corynebacterium liangguodongii]